MDRGHHAHARRCASGLMIDLELLREIPAERELRREREALLSLRDWRWFDIGDEWEEFQRIAAERDAISDRVEWTRRWSPDFNLLGVVGEALYGRLTQQERGAGFGDGGFDFPGVDVKATSHWQSPRLLRLATDPLRADYFALIAVDLVAQRARYVGHATRSELEKAELVEYGYGLTRTILVDDLHQELP